MGSNHAQTKFRIIKIDRTELRELLLSDDKVIYDPGQIREVLNMIDVGKYQDYYTGVKLHFLSKNLDWYWKNVNFVGFVNVNFVKYEILSM